MELPPKMPTEQPPLFDESELPIPDDGERKKAATAPKMTEAGPEMLQTDELERLFEEKVGYSARTRFLGRPETERRATLIEGIHDPKKGKDSVRAWDAEYDQIGDAWSRK